MFVQIAGVSKRPEAVFTFEGLEAGMRSDVDFKAIFAGIHFATINA